MTTRVVFLSGGVGSWAAAMRVRDGMEPGDRLVLLFTDTKTEDASTYAFLEAGAAKALEGVDGEFVKLADGRDIWEVFRDVRMIGNTRIDPCSRVLKRELAADYITKTFDPADTVLYVGIDWTEVNRLPVIVRNWQPFTVRAPLMAKPYLTKAALIAWAESEGLPIPELYARGFPHANCGGACVKAGHAQWARLLREYPERYAHHEEREQSMRDYLGRDDVAILRDRRDGGTQPLTLASFRERIETASAGQGSLWDVYDPDDWGGCGCFTDYDEAAR